MFDTIKFIRPFFFSLREIDNNVSLDIKLPLSWKYEEIVKPYRSIKSKIQDKNDKFSLLSLISTATQEGYDVVFSCAKEIVDVNREEEEKEKLFQQKVKELKELFKTGSLEKLKDINLLDEYGQEITSGVRVVEEGVREGSDGDTPTQE